MKLRIISFSILTFFIFISLGKASNITVVMPGDTNQTYKFAANEFSKYAGLMLNERISMITDTGTVPVNPGVVVIIGNSSINAKLGTLEMNTGVNYSKDIPPQKDSFIIRSITYKGTPYLILSGRDDVGTLYAVYHYLENVCKIGFFEDGERIPKLKELPVKNLYIVEKPYFENRFYRFWVAPLKKHGFSHWSKEDWKRELTWLAKKKMNSTWSWIFREDFPFGSVFDVAYPETGEPFGTTKEIMDSKRKIGREVYDYGRMVGVRFDHFLDYGIVPIRFKNKHPELKYLKGVLEQYGEAILDPNDPRTEEVFAKFIKALIDVYGTDHLYEFDPYGEDTATRITGDWNDEAFGLKTKAWLEAYKTVKTIDPEAFIRWGGWDYTFYPMPHNVMRPENIRKYYTDMAPKDAYQSDSAMDWLDKHEIRYKNYDYYSGHKFGMGTLLTLGGHIALHGKLDEMARRFNEITIDPNPKAKNCTGLYHESECTGQNMLMYEMYFQSAWNPSKYKRDAFVKDFCERRYGSKGLDKMVKATNLVIDAMLTTGDANDYIYSYGGWLYPNKGDNNYCLSNMATTERNSTRLKNAMEIMLSEKDNQKDNPLYEADLNQYLMAYAHEIFKNQISQAFLYSTSGDKEKFEEAAKNSINAFDATAQVMSTRKEFSVRETIKDVLNQKEKLSLETERDIKASFAAWYNSTPTYEQMILEHKPILLQYINSLRKKLIGINYPISKRPNLAATANVSADSEAYGGVAINVIDGINDIANDKTWWSSSNKGGAWITLKWPPEINFNRITILERYDVISDLSIQIFDKNTKDFKEIKRLTFKPEGLGKTERIINIKFPETYNTAMVRVYVNDSTWQVSLYDIGVYKEEPGIIQEADATSNPPSDESQDNSQDSPEKIMAAFADKDLNQLNGTEFKGTTTQAVVNAMKTLKTVDIASNPPLIKDFSKGVEIIMGSPVNKEMGLRQIETFENGRTYTAEVSGSIARIASSRSSMSIDRWHIGFDVDDRYIYNSTKGTPVDITVEYFDIGHGDLLVQYDSPDKNPLDQTTYKDSERIALGDTKTWKSHTFHIPDARFSNKQWGTNDFTVTCYNGPEHDGSVQLRRVYLVKTAGK